MVTNSLLIPKLLAGLAMGLFVATAALAQTSPTSPARQRAANRAALREARRTEAPYKDSHLAVSPQQLKRGGSEGAEEAPRLRHNGRPRSGWQLPGFRRKP